MEFNSYSMSHDVRCIGSSVGKWNFEQSIANSEPNSGISWPEWWWREEMAHNNEVAKDRTTNQDLEIKDPSTEPSK